jgi:hypothetical protein
MTAAKVRTRARIAPYFLARIVAIRLFSRVTVLLEALRCARLVPFLLYSGLFC